MRIDAISIFPDFFSVLDLSLLGKAKESGLIQFKAHDLRNYTHDRHRTVDDTPYGGQSPGERLLMRFWLENQPLSSQLLQENSSIRTSQKSYQPKSI
jgi:tRNA (guanine-N1)-methyltransferase